MIKTIQQYAADKGTSQQNIRQSKTLPIVKLPVFVLYKDKYIQIGEQKFIEIENNFIDNEQVTTNT